MRTWWKRVLAALVLGLLPVAAQAAVTWQVVGDTDCTGLNAATGLSTAPTPCCRTAATGGGNYCGYRMNMSANFMRQVVLVAGTGGTYTNPGGDQLVAAQLARIGLQNVIAAVCGNASNGMDVIWNVTAPTTGYAYGAKIQLFAAGTGVTGGGELANSTAVANVSATCLLIGN